MEGWDSAAGLRRSPAFTAYVATWTYGRSQRVVVDADVGPVQAGAPKGAARGQSHASLGQILELDLFPGAHEEVVARILGRAPAHDHVASHDRAREERVQGLRPRPDAGAGDAVGVVRHDVVGEDEAVVRRSLGGDDVADVDRRIVVDDDRARAVHDLKEPALAAPARAADVDEQIVPDHDASRRLARVGVVAAMD